MQQLVSTEWLADHIADADLRVLDCTVFLSRDDGGGLRIEGGREEFARGHIPGSAFADLPGELADRDSELRFTMPPPEQFADAMSGYGIDAGTRVVVYDRAGNAWATRIWWMLRAFGFDDAAVLDGGWTKWTAEGRLTSIEPPAYPPARFVAVPRPELIADHHEVLAAVGDDASCILNALSEELHRGEGPAGYDRAGRIASSVNVPAASILDPATNAYLPLEQLRERFEAVGATTSERVITYCGGGIAATSDAFVLTLLGVDNVAVYDGSLSEWAADPALPMEAG